MQLPEVGEAVEIVVNKREFKGENILQLADVDHGEIIYLAGASGRIARASASGSQTVMKLFPTPELVGSQRREIITAHACDRQGAP